MSDRGDRDSHKSTPTTSTATVKSKQPGWVKLLRDVPVVLSSSSLKKEETKPKVPWRTIDDELMIEDTAAPLTSSDSDSGASRSSSGQSGTSSSDSSSSSSSSSSDSSVSGSGSGSGSSESNQSTLSTHMSSDLQSSGSDYRSITSFKESIKKDERDHGITNDEGNDHSDDGDQSTNSLTVMDAVPQNKDWRRQLYDETGNHESSAGILDAGTIWGRVVGDTILSTSNESSLNYSDTSDITGFSMPYAASATRPPHEDTDNDLPTNGEGEDENDGNDEDTSHSPRQAQTPDTADALVGDEHSDSPNDALVDSGETSMDEMLLRPMASTTTQQKDEPHSSPITGTVPPRKTDPAEEGGFLAFLAQMRQLTEQPVDAALREFVPPDMAENARAANPYNPDDDAVTVQVRNEDQERKINPRNRRNAGMSSSDAARGGSMDWRFSIPPDAQNSNYPLLGDRDDKKTPDFREIPLSYSPSARMQPWGPNTDDLWTSTTRLLAAIPEEVASVISTASMSLSYIKIGQQPGNAGPDPKWIRERKICLAIAVLATLIITVVGVVFVVSAITNSNTTSLVTNGEPMSPPMIRTAGPSAPTQAPIASPALRGSSLPSGQPSNRMPQAPIKSQTPITSPPETNIPSTPSLSPFPSELEHGPGIPRTTESPSTSPSSTYTSRKPALAPVDSVPIPDSPSILPSFDPTVLTESPSSNGMTPGLAPGDEGTITESPSIAPSLDFAFLFSEAPTLDQIATTPMTGNPSSIPSMGSAQDITPGPISNSPFPPSLFDFLDELQPTSSPSGSSSMPSVDSVQDFTPGPISLSPNPPSLPEVLSKLQPSSVPSVSSLNPMPTKWTAAPTMQFPTFAIPSVSPDLGTGYGPIDLEPNVTFQPTLMFLELTDQPTAMPTALPSVSPTMTPVEDVVTSVPTEPSDEHSSHTWELMGQIGNEGGYRSVKVSDDGRRVAIATTSQLQVFERTIDDVGWHQLGDSISVEGIHAISISGDGNTVAQGTFFDGYESNSVAVYRWIGTAWVQMGSDVPGACAFPGSLELSSNGSIIAIGNPFQLFYSGYVEVLEYDETLGDWKRRGELIPGENSGDMAGTSVSLSSDGSVVAFGSPGRTDGTQINIGQAAIYQYNPTFGWSQVGTTLSGYDPLKQFGYSISLSGNGTRVAISAPLADPQGDLRCMVYVFEASMSDDPSWHPVGEGIEGLFLADNSGLSVSLASDGLTLAVGAPRRRYVQILAMTPEEGWTQIGFIESSRDQFGSSISLASDGRMVAASGSNTFEDGIVQIFQHVEHA
jgi:hypothetical protein